MTVHIKEYGDWVEVIVNDSIVYEGHKVTVTTLERVLEKVAPAVLVKTTFITDK